jgi:hypothetical protein
MTLCVSDPGRVTVAAPAEWLTDLDVDRHADELIANGFCRVSAPPIVAETFATMVDEYPTIAADVKQSFSFPDATDGFLPFGMERSRTTQRVDLCERFCYRQAFQGRRGGDPFVRTAFFAAAVAAEQALWTMADGLMHGIARRYGRWSSPEIRRGSYLQFCAYQKHYWRPDREFLQDRHEDGNLLTLVMATRDGLVLYPDGSPWEVPARCGEVIAFTGSLLTVLSDGRIAAMDHAVCNVPVPMARSSLVYFALPELTRLHPRFVDGTPVDLEPLANELHQSFGNRPFHSPSHGVGRSSA